VPDAEFLVLGAGITGLAAAAQLGGRAIVLEQEPRPGGLVRTECFGGYWFDRVLHLLHFQDVAVRERVEPLLDDVLAPCPPDAWVETAAGTARFPLQFNLSTLEPEARRRALDGLVRAADSPPPASGTAPPGYDEYLLQSFGEGLCELFYHPYNRKLWRRPLASLVPVGQTWNLERPSLEEARLGATVGAAVRPGYNASGFYPRPPAGAPQRGMEVLTRALAERVPHLHLETRVEGIDPARRTVTARRGGELVTYRYGEACLCTLPLPHAIRMCEGAPAALRATAAALLHNGVLSVAFCVRGPRPASPGQWRYYADESLCFTRLVFMTEFDALMAPEEGWGVLAEIPFRSEAPPPADDEVVRLARRDLARSGVLPPDSVIVDARVMRASPAYVVFTRGAEAAAGRCREHLAAGGIAALGRYGRWEYSSMAQGMAQGFRWADAVSSGVSWSSAVEARA
jgi:protoporphyrinogen oxidase